LNESKKGSGMAIFKPYEDRLDTKIVIFSFLNKFVESAVDQELLFDIPFNNSVCITSICIAGFEDGTAPKEIKIFKNRNNIDFSNVSSLKADQEIKLTVDTNAELFYKLKNSKFQNVNLITL
jgi:hypothetical protein